MLSHGARSNIRDAGGATPLHYAAANGHKEVVQMLMKKGADKSVRDHEGRTPQEYARRNNHDEVAKLFDTKKKSVSNFDFSQIL